MLLASIILQAVQPIRNERSTASIYHLLQGKRSAQTLQDAHMYGLTNLFGIYPKLSRELFDQLAEDLLENKIEMTKTPIPYFDGMAYQSQTDIFLYRLLLLLQMLSNSANGEKRYIPVTDQAQVQYWVKQLYRQNQPELTNWRSSLYEELYGLLEKLPEMQAGLFVDRISGYQHIGLTAAQLAAKYKLHEIDVPLYQTSTVHYFLNQVRANKSLFPYLGTLIEQPKQQSNTITSTAHKTRMMLERGLTLDQIAAARKLTENTIKDHIVELTWLEGRRLASRFISEKDAAVIMDCAEKTGTNKLKQIHAALNGKYDYFQIRMALALRNKQEVQT
ncbi:helix-turn-helix domain-containing protein [Terribacillus sp. DMT04]|uniref:helix-turn-helix domain-containing protein n=1 Tax=Terribacillus sp. DMT04 TaxID=2850441 RepID=UPI001C2C77E4|nr:helix-turn-helix domain-containing protein [Terribacillus sp. DMT04]QXE00301.1 helix-turn-helix domain-containing protein [Terribacillus sp. DMT04]